MSAEGLERLRQERLKQPLKELLRKRRKAERKGFWTQEDLDHAKADAAETRKRLGW